MKSTFIAIAAGLALGMPVARAQTAVPPASSSSAKLKLVGSVHSGVAMAMARVAKDSGTILIVPNARADAVTGSMCAPNICRSSLSCRM